VIYRVRAAFRQNLFLNEMSASSIFSALNAIVLFILLVLALAGAAYLAAQLEGNYRNVAIAAASLLGAAIILLIILVALGVTSYLRRQQVKTYSSCQFDGLNIYKDLFSLVVKYSPTRT
jgi:cytochrome bd-type quinol oxidase subunit 2